MYLPKGGRPRVNSSVAHVILYFPLSSICPGIPDDGSGRPFPDDEVHFLLIYRWDMCYWHLEPGRRRHLTWVCKYLAVSFLGCNDLMSYLNVPWRELVTMEPDRFPIFSFKLLFWPLI